MNDYEKQLSIRFNEAMVQMMG